MDHAKGRCLKMNKVILILCLVLTGCKCIVRQYQLEPLGKEPLIIIGGEIKL